MFCFIVAEAGLTCDSDLTELDPTDLHELFPGPQHRRLRHVLKEMHLDIN